MACGLLSVAGSHPREHLTCEVRFTCTADCTDAQEKLCINRNFYPVAVGVARWGGDGRANGIVCGGKGWRGLGLFLWVGLRVGNMAVLARGCDMGGFYLLGDTDITRTRKRMTAHSRALRFLGSRIARAALACAFAVGERAQVARAYSEFFPAIKRRVRMRACARARAPREGGPPPLSLAICIPPKKNWTRFNLMVPFSYVRDIGEEEPNGRDARSVS